MSFSLILLLLLLLLLTVTSFLIHDGTASAFTSRTTTSSSSLKRRPSSWRVFSIDDDGRTTPSSPSHHVVVLAVTRKHDDDDEDGLEEEEASTILLSSPRRSFLSTTLLGASAVLLSFGGVPSRKDTIAWGATDDVIEPPPTNESTSDASFQSIRTRLLQMIRSSKDTSGTSEDDVLAIINELVPYDPSGGKGATFESDLDGEWKLLWSAKAEAFSPLLTLPPPFTPVSYQYLGDASAKEVGQGRVAQGLTGGALLSSNQLWLSSGVRPSLNDPSVLEILPPFRLELGGPYRSGRPKTRIVEAGSDAEFRKLNARTSEAQAAPKNSYKQLYLERDGKGSIRISTITEGDPVIVGAIFVHEKM